MYEFLSNIKDQNKSWSVNSWNRASSISSFTSSGPCSCLAQINASHLILKQHLAETGKSDSASCAQHCFPLFCHWKEMKWQELCFTPCAGGLCHFSSSKTHCKSSHRGSMKSDWQSKGTETSMWQNEVNCVTKAFPISSVSDAKGVVVQTRLPICQKEFEQRCCQQRKSKLCSIALPSKSSSTVTGNQTLAKSGHLYTKREKKNRNSLLGESSVSSEGGYSSGDPPQPEDFRISSCKL